MQLYGFVVVLVVGRAVDHQCPTAVAGKKWNICTELSFCYHKLYDPCLPRHMQQWLDSWRQSFLLLFTTCHDLLTLPRAFV